MVVPILSFWSLKNNKKYTITNNNRVAVYAVDNHLVTLRGKIADDNILKIYINEQAEYVNLEDTKILNRTFEKIRIIK